MFRRAFLSHLPAATVLFSGAQAPGAAPKPSAGRRAISRTTGSIRPNLSAIQTSKIARCGSGASRACGSRAVRAELTANTIGRARIVPAGIVVVTRAQERGYALVSVG